MFGETSANCQKIEAALQSTNADLWVFPELCTSGYEFLDRDEARRLALDIDNGTEIADLKKLSAERNAVIVLGFPERSSEKVFNSSAVIEPTGRVTRYRKLHLFDREKELFDPGDAPPPVIDTEIGRLGVMICFDWIFPEVARMLALTGAQIICHPSNLVLQYCQRAMFARSVENGVFTITANRIGTEDRAGRTLTFTGASQILSNRGASLAQAAPDREQVIACQLIASDADDKIITARNHIFEDRRVEFYGGRKGSEQVAK